MVKPLRALAGLAFCALATSAVTTLLPGDASATSGAPMLGAYKGGGLRGVTALQAYETWTGVPAQVGVDFTPDDSWASMTGQNWLLDPWRDSGKRLVYSVPMFPKPTTTASYSLEACAAGEYNTHWSTLGKNLVAKRLPTTIVRPGWEFNGKWFHWNAIGKPAAFAECFRQIVGTMRAVPGQAFEFDWNPNIGPGSMAAEQAWPGAQFVDYVGIDVYDQSWVRDTYPIPAGASDADKLARWQRMWEYTLNGDRGLAFWSAFAKQQGVKMSFPEWGLAVRTDGHGGGDNPYYIQKMLEFIGDRANNVGYAAYFDYDAHDGLHRISRSDDLFRTAADAYRPLLVALATGSGVGSSPSPPVTTTSPSPTPTLDPAAEECQRAGGKLVMNGCVGPSRTLTK